MKAIKEKIFNLFLWFSLMCALVGLAVVMAYASPSDVLGIPYSDATTPTFTFTPTPTFSNTNTFTATNTYTATNTFTITNTFTATATWTPTTDFSPTYTFTPTPTFTYTNTFTPTNTPLGWIRGLSPTNTFTTVYTSTPTYTFTNVNTATNTYTNTPVYTITGTNTNTPVYTITRTNTATPDYTATPTYTSTNTPTNKSNLNHYTISAEFLLMAGTPVANQHFVVLTGSATRQVAINRVRLAFNYNNTQVAPGYDYTGIRLCVIQAIDSGATHAVTTGAHTFDTNAPASGATVVYNYSQPLTIGAILSPSQYEFLPLHPVYLLNWTNLYPSATPAPVGVMSLGAEHMGNIPIVWDDNEGRTPFIVNGNTQAFAIMNQAAWCCPTVDIWLNAVIEYTEY
jgi:hypothetical protein